MPSIPVERECICQRTIYHMVPGRIRGPRLSRDIQLDERRVDNQRICIVILRLEPMVERHRNLAAAHAQDNPWDLMQIMEFFIPGHIVKGKEKETAGSPCLSSITGLVSGYSTSPTASTE